MKLCVLSAGLACVLTAAARGAPNLVVDGDFEGRPVERGAFVVVHAVTGWTSLTDAPAIEIQNQYHYDGGTGSAGPQFAELCAGGADGFFQDIPTVPGATYALSFDHSFRPHLRYNGVTVRWDRETMAEVDADGRHHAKPVWTSHTFELTASAATTRLEFEADPRVYDNPYEGGGWVDNVRVTLVSVPGEVTPVTPETPAVAPTPGVPERRPDAVPEPAGAVAAVLTAAMAMLKRTPRRDTRAGA